jgi:hypothetical protein
MPQRSFGPFCLCSMMQRRMTRMLAGSGSTVRLLYRVFMAIGFHPDGDWQVGSARLQRNAFEP